MALACERNYIAEAYRLDKKGAKKADKGDRGRNPARVDRPAWKKKGIIRPVFYRVCDACSRPRSESVLFDAFGMNRACISFPFCLRPTPLLFFSPLSPCLRSFHPSNRVSAVFKSPGNVLILERNISMTNIIFFSSPRPPLSFFLPCHRCCRIFSAGFDAPKIYRAAEIKSPARG